MSWLNFQAYKMKYPTNEGKTVLQTVFIQVIHFRVWCIAYLTDVLNLFTLQIIQLGISTVCLMYLLKYKKKKFCHGKNFELQVPVGSSIQNNIVIETLSSFH